MLSCTFHLDDQPKICLSVRYRWHARDSARCMIYLLNQTVRLNKLRLNTYPFFCGFAKNRQDADISVLCGQHTLIYIKIDVLVCKRSKGFASVAAFCSKRLPLTPGPRSGVKRPCLSRHQPVAQHFPTSRPCDYYSRKSNRWRLRNRSKSGSKDRSKKICGRRNTLLQLELLMLFMRRM